MAGQTAVFVTTLVLRGFTAGTIVGLAMMIPMKPKVGVDAHAKYLVELYRGVGPRIYGAATILVAVGLAILSWSALVSRGLHLFSTLVLASLGLTVLGFVGTFFSLRAMRGLSSAVDRDGQPRFFVDRFARWHVYGACCHGGAFISLSIAAPLWA